MQTRKINIDTASNLGKAIDSAFINFNQTAAEKGITDRKELESLAAACFEDVASWWGNESGSVKLTDKQIDRGMAAIRQKSNYFMV
jgi:hypothetical protein